jgi:hypothetical protein
VAGDAVFVGHDFCLGMFEIYGMTVVLFQLLVGMVVER